MAEEPKSNVIPLRRPEPGPRVDEATERISELGQTLLSEGFTRDDLLIAFGYHFVNMGDEQGATKGQLLEVLCLIHDDFEKMEI